MNNLQELKTAAKAVLRHLTDNRSMTHDNLTIGLEKAGDYDWQKRLFELLSELNEQSC